MGTIVSLCSRGRGAQSHDESRVEREWSGIYIEFEGAGSIGHTDAFQTILAITNAFVLIGKASYDR